MWWNEPGWAHMHGGWWFMPFFGLICMIIFIFLMSRIFSGRGCCDPGTDNNTLQNNDLRDLKDEIRKLRSEVEQLKNRQDS